MHRLCLLLLLFCAFAHSENCSVTLEEAIVSSLRYNYLLQAEKFSELEGDARVRAAWGRFWPEVVWRGEISDYSVPDDEVVPLCLQGNIVEGRQVIVDFDAIFNLKEKEHQLLALRFNVEAFVDNLIFDVRRAYYLVAISLANVHVQEENVKLLEEQAEREKGRLEAGTSTQFELDQARVATTNAMAQLFAARREYKNNQSILAGLMGLDATRSRCLDPVIDEMPLKEYPLISDKITYLLDEGVPETMWTPGEKEWWKAKMMLGRSDLKEREALIAAASSGVHRRQSEYLPRVDGFARFVNLSNNDFGTLFKFSDDSYWETGISFRWSLFDGFARQNRVREAKLNRCKQVAYYQKALQDATLGLQDRFDDIEEAAQGYIAAASGVRISEAGAEFALERRNIGAISPLEYRDAVNHLTDARQRELRASYSLLVAYFALRRDTGLDRLEGRYRCP